MKDDLIEAIAIGAIAGAAVVAAFIAFSVAVGLALVFLHALGLI